MPPPPLLPLITQCTTLTTFKQIHAVTITAPFPTSTFLHNHLLSKLLTLSLPYSLLLLSTLPSPNDYSYNIAIRSLSSSHPTHSLHLHLLMLRRNLRPDNFTFPSLLIACANLPSLPHGRATHASVTRTGFTSNDHTKHSLITMYSRCGDITSARNVFDQITVKDIVSWNSMISGYSKMGYGREAVEVFRRMRGEGVPVNEMTVASVLAACGDVGDLGLGRRLEEMVEEEGLDVISFVGSALVDMYGKCGDLVAARRVFDGLPKRDIVSWNSMITGYSQNGQSEQAIALFTAMGEARVLPDKITLVGVLSACATGGNLQLGQQLDALASERGLIRNVYVGTALIDMYAKCGNLDRAVQIFDGMPHKNIVSWNAMISALAFHGRGEEAIALFRRMRTEEVTARPDHITFIGVLSACVHAGLVEEGRRWFNSIEQLFGVVPRIEHYSCMVDLLARAGHLEEAWDFTEKMGEKVDSITLGALLRACRNHKNVEVGEKVLKRVLELEPRNSGNYVTASKMYAGSKRWDDSAKMRGLMRDRGVSKTPGCSWIEVDSQVQNFHSGDELHIRAAEIYQMMDVLLTELEIEGYIPDTELE